jgi:uncharacterized membrane protein
MVGADCATLGGRAMTTILLFTIAVILAVGLVAVLSVLVEIRDAVADARAQMQRVADAMEEDEEDEWAVVRGNPPFGAGYGSGKGQAPRKETT